MKILALAAAIMVSATTGFAQERERGSLTAGSSSAGLGLDSLPPANTEHGYFAGSWGLNLNLGWSYLDWNVGPASGSERIFAPQVSLFYKMIDNLDVNLSILHLSGKDNDDILGPNKGELTRIALGLRYWMPTGTRVAPFIGGGIGYYIVDGTTDFVTAACSDCPPAQVTSISINDQPGAFLEAGASYLVSDGFMINTGLSYDFLLGSADATINGRKDRFDIEAFSINLGVSWKF